MLLVFAFLIGLAYYSVGMHMKRLSAARLRDGEAASGVDTAQKDDPASTGAAHQRAVQSVEHLARLQKPRRVTFRWGVIAPTVWLLFVLAVLYLYPLVSLLLRREKLRPTDYLFFVLTPAVLGFFGYKRYSREQSYRRLLAEGEVALGWIVGRVEVRLRGKMPQRQQIVTYKYRATSGVKIDTCYCYLPLDAACTAIPIFYDETGVSVAERGTPYAVLDWPAASTP